MRRRRTTLARAAAQVETDLRRTTGRPWRCTVTRGLLLTVTDGTVGESVLLDDQVDDWSNPVGSSAAQITDGLESDALEVVCTEVLEILRALDEPLPVCPDHRRPLGACSGVWTCDHLPSHDIPVGRLGLGRSAG